MNKILKLDPQKIIETLVTLEKRISERFPDSGLRKVCMEVLENINESTANIAWISRPNIPLRLSSFLIILLGLGGLAYSITFLDLKITDTTLSSIATVSEALVNDLILIGAAIFFFLSLETRIKRKRALQSLNELRVIVHIIDMHQLTKDPNLVENSHVPTSSSPKRTLSKFELQRYLDYCSEATAIISKVAALYAQSLDDEVVIRSVNEIEVLCTGLSRKIWQKLIILDNAGKD
ncbi:MAG: hypothetical protein ABIT06_06030 [Saprospiraceae bacterium]